MFADFGSASRPRRRASIEELEDRIEGIIIPVAIRMTLSDEEYAALEGLLIARSERCGIPLAGDPADSWGDQREED